VYRVTTDQQSQPQIDALAPFAEVRATLEVAPWAGDSPNDDNPNAPFGPDPQGMHARAEVTCRAS
jgi:hypothetical protein